MAGKSSVPVAKAKPASKPGKGRAAIPEEVEILYNRKLRHDYEVIERWEAGMVLQGSEVKSLRNTDVQWADAHARMDRDELWLYGLHIGEYRQAGVYGHQPQQTRKLLLQRRHLDKLQGALQTKGLTVIPERLLFRKGWAKVVICLCKGKTHDDKRQDLVKRATDRDVARELSRRMKRGA
jgi:SsrA-binding protein